MKNSGSQKMKGATKVNPNSPIYQLLVGKWLGKYPTKNRAAIMPKGKNVA